MLKMQCIRPIYIDLLGLNNRRWLCNICI